MAENVPNTFVPMSHPATANKNSDGTYTVRIQHTVEGSITEVHFTNVFFAGTLANAYADMINGKAALEAKVGQLVDDAKPVVADATEEIKKLIAEAEVEAGKLLSAAKSEASSLKSEASAVLADAKVEAEKLLADARKEADALIAAGKAAVEKYREKPAPAPAPAEEPAPAAKTVEEE